MKILSRPIEIARIWPYFVILLVIAVLAFWPSYFGAGLLSQVGYTHFHAISATVWMAMLIVQPWLIRKDQYTLHRRIGLASYVVAPVLIVSVILLANYRIRIATAENYQIQTYILYLQVFLAILFALSYILAMVYRNRSEIHARFMVCTGLTLIDPIFARILIFTMPVPIEYHQFITFGLTDLVFLVLIFAERKNLAGRWVFPLMLGVFILLQVPAFFAMGSPTWQAFAEWFRSIPLT